MPRSSVSSGAPKPLSTIATLATHKHGSVTSGEALGFLFREFTANRVKESAARISLVEPLSAATDRLRKLLTDICQPTDGTLKWAIDYAIDRQVARAFPTQERYEVELRQNETQYDQDGISSLRQELAAWSEVEDVLSVLFGDLDKDAEVAAALAILRACPNTAFFWKLVGDSVGHWPVVCYTLNQQAANLKTTFIWEAIASLGRPLPLTEIAALFQQQHGEYNERTEDVLRTALTPVELAFAVSKGAILIECQPEQANTRGKSTAPKSALKINPLLIGL